MSEYLALQVAIIAFVYATILTEEGMLLGGVYSRLEKWSRNNTTREYLLKPVLMCSKCVAGQLAFWAYLFTTTNHHLLEHAYVCALSILITLPLRKFYIWTLRN